MNQRTVRDGDWKLFIDSPGRAMLYDLRNDVGERNDVSASNTAVVRRLAQLLAGVGKGRRRRSESVSERCG